MNIIPFNGLKTKCKCIGQTFAWEGRIKKNNNGSVKTPESVAEPLNSHSENIILF